MKRNRKITWGVVVVILGLAFNVSANILEENFQGGQWELYGYLNPQVKQKNVNAIYVTKPEEIVKSVSALNFMEVYGNHTDVIYNYFLEFHLNDAKKDIIALNTELNIARYKNKYYSFDVTVLEDLINSHLRTETIHYTFNDVIQARSFVDQVQQNSPHVLVVDEGKRTWMNHGGYLVFGAKVSPLQSDLNAYCHDVKTQLEQKFVGIYSEPKMKLYEYENDNYVVFYMYCSPDVAMNFYDYPLLQEWTPFGEIELTIIGMNKKELKSIVTP